MKRSGVSGSNIAALGLGDHSPCRAHTSVHQSSGAPAQTLLGSCPVHSVNRDLGAIAQAQREPCLKTLSSFFIIC